MKESSWVWSLFNAIKNWNKRCYRWNV